MNKTLIKNEQEYRQFAFDIIQNTERYQDNVMEALGAYLDMECWDYNDKNQPIDEQGNVIPEDSPDTLKLADDIKEFKYPVLVLHTIEREWDRRGDIDVIIVEFVTLEDFKH